MDIEYIWQITDLSTASILNLVPHKTNFRKPVVQALFFCQMRRIKPIG